MSHRFRRAILLSARSGNILLGVAVIIIVIVIIIAPIGIAVQLGDDTWLNLKSTT